MSEIKGLMSTMAKKWKLEQIPNKKLELENRLMEERLNQLKNELNHERQKRSAFGGTVWTKASPGPVKNYGKSALKSADSKPNDDSPKLTHKQMKLKMLKDEIVTVKNEISASNNSSRNGSGVNGGLKKQKCGQCEKSLAFTRCLECGEDYCANCFTNFHLKGALQKHRTVPIYTDELARLKMPIINSELSKSTSLPRANESASSSAASSAKQQHQPKQSLLEGAYDEQESHEAFKQALLEWRNQSNAAAKPLAAAASRRESDGMATNRDAIIGNDEPIYSFRAPDEAKIKQAYEKLDERIRTNSDLSYAERLLLNKYRREGGTSSRSDSRNSGGQLNGSYSGRNVVNHFRTSGGSVSRSLTDSSSTLTDNETVDETEHISFSSIMKALNIPESTSEVAPSQTAETLIIEEISTTSIDFRKPKQLVEATFEMRRPTEMITSVTESPKLPAKRDDIVLNKSKTESEFKLPGRSVKVKSASAQKPAAAKELVSASLNPAKTPASTTTTTTTAAVKTRSSLAVSNLTRAPSKNLQAISSRRVDSKSIMAASANPVDASSILMINVNASGSGDASNPNSSRVSSGRKSSEKITFSLSSKFFEKSQVKNWRPSSSLSVDLAEEAEPNKEDTARPVSKASTMRDSVKTTKKSVESVETRKSSTSTSMRLSQKLEKSLKIEKSEEKKTPAPPVVAKEAQNFTIKIPKNAQTRAKTELNLKKATAAAQATNLALNKSVTFIGKDKKKGPDSHRPKSAMALKLETIEGQFSQFDLEDDGRSSRLCQNEDDNEYFGDLVSEFKKSVHRMAASIRDDGRQKTEADVLVGEVNEKLLQESLSILEKTLTDAGEQDEFADEDNWQSESVEVSNLK